MLSSRLIRLSSSGTRDTDPDRVRDSENSDKKVIHDLPVTISTESVEKEKLLNITLEHDTEVRTTIKYDIKFDGRRCRT